MHTGFAHRVLGPPEYRLQSLPGTWPIARLSEVLTTSLTPSRLILANSAAPVTSSGESGRDLYRPPQTPHGETHNREVESSSLSPATKPSCSRPNHLGMAQPNPCVMEHNSESLLNACGLPPPSRVA